MSDDAFARAVEAAAARYASAGRISVGVARGKLSHDPVYRGLLERGVGEATSVTDLGCGRGLLLALILEAGGRESRPQLRGVEVSPDAVRLARLACGDRASISEVDLAEAELPRSEAVTLVDVLHYLPLAVQDRLLERIRASLAPGGRLFIRDADSRGGGGFLAVRLMERLAALGRGEGFRPLVYRPIDELAGRLVALGMTVAVEPMGAGTPFANVLLEARIAP